MDRICRATLAVLVIGLVAQVSTASADAVDDFQGSWVDRALDLQYELGGDVGFDNAPVVGTHNSFNSIAEMGPTLSAQDSNQAINLVDQLDINIRSLELDLHRFPSLDGPGYRPVVCHALGGGIGCTVEKTIGPVLDEIVGWLDRPTNADQVLFLYLEDDLQDVSTHNDATAIIRAKFGSRLYLPPQNGQCNELPGDLSRNDVRDSGKQVIIVANCGSGNWPSVIHSWERHREERPFDYEDFPSCGPVFTTDEYQSSLIRYYEDSTQLTAQFGTPDDGIDPATAAAMARCGVDLIGLDQLQPGDGRLRSLVWSWSPGEPRAGGNCAQAYAGKGRQFGRWVARDCRAKRRRSACLTAEGNWTIPKHKKRGWYRARRICEKFDAQLAVPRTGYENQLLRVAMQDAGVKSTWLGYRQVSGTWTAIDPR